MSETAEDNWLKRELEKQKREREANKGKSPITFPQQQAKGQTNWLETAVTKGGQMLKDRYGPMLEKAGKGIVKGTQGVPKGAPTPKSVDRLGNIRNGVIFAAIAVGITLAINTMAGGNLLYYFIGFLLLYIVMKQFLFKPETTIVSTQPDCTNCPVFAKASTLPQQTQQPQTQEGITRTPKKIVRQTHEEWEEQQ